MKMTKQEAIELHRELWNRIARLEKPEHFKKFKIAEEISKERNVIYPNNGCFCCEYAARQGDFSKVCRYCPIDWGSRVGCAGRDSLYAKWERTTSKEEFSQLAEEIANFPERS